MDLVREAQNNLMDAIDFHDPDWVEKAWMREDASGFCQHAARERRDNDGVERLEVDRPDKLCDPGDSALGVLQEEEGVDAAPVRRGNLGYTSRGRHKSHKCDHCDIPAFEYPKDLSRHINDIHEMTKRYRCPVGCRSFKRKDNFRRHLRAQHAKFLMNLNVNLESFLVMD